MAEVFAVTKVCLMMGVVSLRRRMSLIAFSRVKYSQMVGPINAQ